MHLLDIEGLSEQRILELFDMARRLKSGGCGKPLSGKDFVLFFPEASLRTRITFEKGIGELGGRCILFPPETLDKREAPQDVIRYLEKWADGIVVRHPDLSKLRELASFSAIPVINAMTSANHPCEILSDLFSLSELRQDYRDLVYAFVGPAGNIARSWVEAARVLDLRLKHICTEDNRLDDDHRNYSFSTDLETALKGVDVVLTDSLPTVLCNNEYIHRYQITLERMRMANPGSLLNSCPPFFRGEEVSREVIDSEFFVGYSFKRNLIYVQQAVILSSLGIQI
ncbi:ornithine carbamoyltransferase [Cohnella terricola]|uniref:Ornithine carbamoyltransferase n=1 Tax=Cohnella terricola TaxID=1289167 RepID=A0A559J652_9BACL|nr:ornithine carbamoyltransferase [Cohnella terricola]TVX95331.1 ornithine carbamoyltransferase [Cohnella terricola]